MKRIYIVLAIITSIMLGSCTTNTNKDQTYQCPMKCEGEKTFAKQGSCIICNMALKPIKDNTKTLASADDISDSSIFNLTTKWNTEEGNTIELKELKGKTLVMVMIYTTCKAACPRLVADMRNIEKKLPKENLKNTQFVLISRVC